jgi:mRNA interferase RelE/StbE
LSEYFKIAETETFQNKIETLKYKKLHNKIFLYIYPLLRTNPFFGPNIKKLKGKFEGIYRYRTGNYRLFYKIDIKKMIVFILDIYDRKNAY